MQTNWTPSIAVSTDPLYLEIVDALASDIAAGRLSVDFRLPTQRELADRLGVAIGTVTRAYAEAERRGLIRSEGRRGTFVGEPQTPKAILSSIARGVQHGIDLSKNHPLPSLDPALPPALRQLAKSRDIQHLLVYPPAAGLPSHREAGAQWLTRLGLPCDPEAVFVTDGAQHAISIILAAETRPGDTIAAEQCTYPGLTAAAEIMNLAVIGIPMDDLGIVPDALDAICRRKKIRLLYLNPSLHNPTTIISPMSRRREIAAVAEKHGVMIIEDEIMRPLLTEHPGYVASVLPEQSYLVISASKAIAAGLRVGFIVAPFKVRQRLVESINASCLGAPPLLTELVALWLADGTADAIISRRIQESAARQKLAASLLSGFRFKSHPSAYHLWLELPESWTGMKLAMEAQMRGVVISPAEAFAVDRRATIPAARISVGVPSTREAMTRGLEIITDILRGSPTRLRPTV